MDLEDLKRSLDVRFDAVAELVTRVAHGLEQQMSQRFDMVERRLDRVENRLTSIEMQIGGINRSMTGQDRSMTELLARQLVQQKAIDDLVSRVSKLEQDKRPS